MKDDEDWAKVDGPPDNLELDKDIIAASELDSSAPLISDFAKQAATELGRRVRGFEPPIRTPYLGLNKLLDGGFSDGFYVLVGNRRSGKTQMAVQMAITAAHANHPVLYASPVSPRTHIYARMLSVLDKKPWSHLTRPADKEYESSSLWRLYSSPSAKWLREDDRAIRLFDGECSEQTVLEIAHHMRGLHPDKAPFIVVDPIQQVGSALVSTDNVATATAKLSTAATQAAKETGAVVLLVSVSAPLCHERLADRTDFKVGHSDPTQLLGSGKDSGEIEFEANATLVLCTTSEGENRQYFIAVAGSRDGPTDWAGPFFFEEGALFVEEAELTESP